MIDGAVQLEFGAALQLHEVRAMIETTAARLAAVRRTEADLAAMRGARTTTTPRRTSTIRKIYWSKPTCASSRSIVEASHNVVLMQVMTSISALLKEHRRHYASARERRFREIVLTEHQDIPRCHHRGRAPPKPLGAVQIHMRDIWLQIEQTALRDGDSTSLTYSYLPMYP